MSDNQVLMLVLVLLYLWESGRWARNDSIVFRPGWWDGELRPGQPRSVLGLGRPGLAHGGLLPPLQPALVCPTWPVSLAPDGALAYVAEAPHPDGRLPQPGLFVRWEDARPIEASGGSVRIAGRAFLTGLSPALAARVATRLAEIAARPRPRREEAIRQLLDDAYDLGAIQARLDALRARSRWTRRATDLLFLHLFVVAPVLVIRFGAAWAWPLVLGPLVVLMAIAAVLFARAHRRLRPAAGGERLRETLLMLVYAPMTLRAVDPLAAGLLDDFHPLAAAAAVCPEPAFRDFARRTLLDLHHPIAPTCPTGEPAAQAVEQSWRERSRRRAEDFLRGRQVDVEALLRPPEPLDERSRSFCPRCQEQFVLTEGSCADCGGLALVALPARSATGKDVT